jgi:hypothetical protein
MTPREIQAAMKRLFYGDLLDADPWCHIFDDAGQLDERKCLAFLNRYFDSTEVILYGGTVTSAVHCVLAEAPGQIARMLQEGKGVRVCTVDFQARAIVNPIGVAKGRSRSESPSVQVPPSRH